jgi:hypothetical protein
MPTEASPNLATWPRRVPAVKPYVDAFSGLMMRGEPKSTLHRMKGLWSLAVPETGSFCEKNTQGVSILSSRHASMSAHTCSGDRLQPWLTQHVFAMQHHVMMIVA